jgi:DHA1 family multidrug resistance protein-like MFS transporter
MTGYEVDKMSCYDDARSDGETNGKWLIGPGRPFPPALPDRELYLVDFEGPDDPLNPQNWSLFTK